MNHDAAQSEREKVIEQCYILATKYFNNSVEQTLTWFNSTNPLFGCEPITMIMRGQEKELLKIIINTMEE